jgi:menaquinone-dependent protoporphyrinogen oxidase
MADQVQLPAAAHGQPRVLITAASARAGTEEIAQVIAMQLAAHGLRARVSPAPDVVSVDGFDAVVLGSAVYRGRWLQSAVDLVYRSHEALTLRPVWLFSSGPVGRPGGLFARLLMHEPADVAEMRAATLAIDHQMFAGRLDLRQLNWPLRLAGLAVPGLAGDFRDWGQIRAWADSIAARLALVGSR